MSNCCLKYTEWLDDLIILTDNNIELNLLPYIQPFNADLSGIWQPMIINTKKYPSPQNPLISTTLYNDLIRDYIRNSGDVLEKFNFLNPYYYGWSSGVHISGFAPLKEKLINHGSEMIGINNFATISNPEFKNWYATNITPTIDIGMTYENTKEIAIIFPTGQTQQQQQALANNFSNFSLQNIQLNGLSDVDETITLTPTVFTDEPDFAITRYGDFNISSSDPGALFTIKLLNFSYYHVNVPNNDIPKNINVSNMLYFVTVNPKTAYNNSGGYVWVFDSSPQHFRYLDKPNKSIVITFQVLISDNFENYQTVNFTFTINGYDQSLPNINPKENIRFADYVFGWYRYYNLNDPTDTRYIPGVDFYFGEIDSFLFYGIPKYISNHQIFEYQSNSHDVQMFKNLDSFFGGNDYITSGVLALLQTSPYIDLLTHGATDIDSYSYDGLGYIRDDYGRSIPYIRGLSSKPFYNFGKPVFVSNKKDIFYRLADKYGLQMIVAPNQTADLVALFASFNGPNISFEQNNTVYQELSVNKTRSFPLLEREVSVGNLKYSLSYPRQGQEKIVLNLDTMQNSPVVFPRDMCACNNDTTNTELQYEAFSNFINVSGIEKDYETEDYFYHILNLRLNNNLIDQSFIFNDVSGIYAYERYSNRLLGDPNIDVLFHGHGGIKTNYLSNRYYNDSWYDTPYRYYLSLFDVNGYYLPDKITRFDQHYNTYNSQSIEGGASDIYARYLTENRVSLGNINISYLRTPSRPECRPFIDIENNSYDNVVNFSIDCNRASPLIYDFVNKYYTSSSYVPSITTYYIPSGSYYANMTSEEIQRINIKLKDHPSPSTSLVKTHDLRLLNPMMYINASNRVSDYETLLSMAGNGNFSAKYPVSHLPAGSFRCTGVAVSGSFYLQDITQSIESGTPTDPIFYEYNYGDISGISIGFDAYRPCDEWGLELKYAPFPVINFPMLTKFGIDAQLGFFHPNKGWTTEPKYIGKTPVAPRVPAPLRQTKNKNEHFSCDEYFWYDAKDMYNEEYLEGQNLIVNTSGLSKNLIELAHSSQFIGFRRNNFLYVTPNFRIFKYIEKESPIKKSIKLSYIDIDYYNEYPFNDFIYNVLPGRSRNRIAVSRKSGLSNKRIFSYFDDAIYKQETLILYSDQQYVLANIIGSYGNNDSLVLTLDTDLPDALYPYGRIKKYKTADSNQSLLLYRSNITRNDSKISIGKWGNIIAGDVDEFDNSSLRKKEWHQSALFLNQNSDGTIGSVKYYFPYAHFNGYYNNAGVRDYSVLPNIGDDALRFDYGLIFASPGQFLRYLYAGPYTGPVKITNKPRIIVGNMTTIDNKFYITTGIVLEDGARIKILQLHNDTRFSCGFNNTFNVIGGGSFFQIGNNSSTPINCNFNGNSEILIEIIPSDDISCILDKVIIYNGESIQALHNKPTNPIFYETYSYFIDTNDRLINRALGSASPLIVDMPYRYVYVDDPGANTKNGLIEINRCSFYNHNDNTDPIYYTNAVGTDAVPLISDRNRVNKPGSELLYIPIEKYTFLNIDKHKYFNPFIDMNIFTNDTRYKSTFIGELPANSGYVYFEGLVEPPISYDDMETPYDINKIWIDIPKNAVWGILTEDNQFFWSNETTSAVAGYNVMCEEEAKKCTSLSPKDSCGYTSLTTEGVLAGYFGNAFSNFITEKFSFPQDCSRLEETASCCLTYPSPKKENCLQAVKDNIKSCKGAAKNPLEGEYYEKRYIECKNQNCLSIAPTGGYMGLDKFDSILVSLRNISEEVNNFISSNPAHQLFFIKESNISSEIPIFSGLQYNDYYPYKSYFDIVDVDNTNKGGILQYSSSDCTNNTSYRPCLLRGENGVGSKTNIHFVKSQLLYITFAAVAGVGGAARFIVKGINNEVLLDTGVLSISSNYIEIFRKPAGTTGITVTVTVYNDDSNNTVSWRYFFDCDIYGTRTTTKDISEFFLPPISSQKHGSLDFNPTTIKVSGTNGLVSVSYGLGNNDWYEDYCANKPWLIGWDGVDTDNYNRQWFSDMQSPGFAKIKTNHPNIVWRNEYLLRSFVPHDNQINGYLGEYDILCTGEYNPFTYLELDIEARLNSEIDAQYNFFMSSNNCKKDSIRTILCSGLREFLNSRCVVEDISSSETVNLYSVYFDDNSNNQYGINVAIEFVRSPNPEVPEFDVAAIPKYTVKYPDGNIKYITAPRSVVDWSVVGGFSIDCGTLEDWNEVQYDGLYPATVGVTGLLTNKCSSILEDLDFIYKEKCPEDILYCENETITIYQVHGITDKCQEEIASSAKFGCPYYAYKLQEDKSKEIDITLHYSRDSCLKYQNKDPMFGFGLPEWDKYFVTDYWCGDMPFQEEFHRFDHLWGTWTDTNLSSKGIAKSCTNMKKSSSSTSDYFKDLINSVSNINFKIYSTIIQVTIPEAVNSNPNDDYPGSDKEFKKNVIFFNRPTNNLRLFPKIIAKTYSNNLYLSQNDSYNNYPLIDFNNRGYNNRYYLNNSTFSYQGDFTLQ